MRHAVLENWARGNGPLHRFDPRAKVICLFLFLAAVSTTPPAALVTFESYLAVTFSVMVISGLPLPRLLLQSAVALPLTISFAAISYCTTGSIAVSAGLIARSQLCVWATLLLVATTPLSLLLGALQQMWVPEGLLEIGQFLYRYLFVIVDQGVRMRWAAAARDGGKLRGGARQSLLDRASGALAVLFACSYKRATGIHRATLARCSGGGFPALTRPRMRARDYLLVAGSAMLLLGVRLAATH